MTEKDHNPSSTHPPLPPTSEDDQFSRLRLLRSRRVGIATYKRLLTEHGTAQNALKALPEIARAAGVEDYEICPEAVVQAELNAARKMGARLLLQGAPAYPSRLEEIEDAPPFIWALGDVSLLTRPLVALVGARNASSLGIRMATRLARDLGIAGHIVVSGLARGIDTAAHRGALESGTIAIQAGGLDCIYPTENADLHAEIASAGLRLSEQPFGLHPMARHFPARNRIISGLSQATIVVEAAAKSGSLITARDALDQGRDVLVVPGHPLDARAAGCNQLLRDGATLIRSSQDVLEAVTPLAAADQSSLPNDPRPATQHAKRKPANHTLRSIAALHDQILSRLSPSPVAEDQLIRDLAVKPAEVAPALLELELGGRIKRDSGGLLTRD
ncbi:MAG: DNA-processing protein DprA [Pseudomonadota bacterium]